jgi:HlyD family secretion protein
MPTHAQMEQAEYELKLGNDLFAKVISQEDLTTRVNAANTAEAQYLQAQANLDAAKTDLERLTVRAPVDGQVMQLKIHLGEFAPTGVLAQPLILFGGVEPMNVR